MAETDKRCYKEGYWPWVEIGGYLSGLVAVGRDRGLSLGVSGRG